MKPHAWRNQNDFLCNISALRVREERVFTSMNADMGNVSPLSQPQQSVPAPKRAWPTAGSHFSPTRPLARRAEEESAWDAAAATRAMLAARRAAARSENIVRARCLTSSRIIGHDAGGTSSRPRTAVHEVSSFAAGDSGLRRGYDILAPGIRLAHADEKIFAADGAAWRGGRARGSAAAAVEAAASPDLLLPRAAFPRRPAPQRDALLRHHDTRAEVDIITGARALRTVES